MTDATGTRSFDYDAATLQLDKENLDATFYDGMTLTRSYEDGTETNGLFGRDAGYSLGGTPSPVSAAYGYDPAGRLKTVSDGTGGAGPGPAAAGFTYTYKPDSNLRASMEGPVHAVAYDYEANRDFMTGIDNRATDLQGVSISKYAYTYVALGGRDREERRLSPASRQLRHATDGERRGPELHRAAVRTRPARHHRGLHRGYHPPLARSPREDAPQRARKVNLKNVPGSLYSL